MSYEDEDADGTRCEEPAAFSGIDSAKISLGLWLLLLAFGGGLLAMYYSRIGYVPDIAWSGLLNYLAILTLIGGAVGLLYGLLLIAPGFIWSFGLIQDEKFQKFLCWGPDGRSGKPCPLAVTRQFIFPFLIFMVFAHWALVELSPGLQIASACVIGVTVIIFYFRQGMLGLGCVNESFEEPEDCIAVCFESEESHWRARAARFLEVLKTLGSMFLSLVFWKPLEQEKCHTDCVSMWLKYALVSGFSYVVAGLSLWVMFQVVAPFPEAPDQLSLLVLCSLSVTLASLFFILLYPLGKLAACSVGVLFALFLIGAGEAISVEAALSSRILSKFGFGGKTPYSMVLSEEGRRLMDDVGMTYWMPMDDGDGETKDIPCRRGSCRSGERIRPPGSEAAQLKDVCLLSGIGKDLIIDVEGKVIMLPKEFVISWLSPGDPAVGRQRQDEVKRHPSCWY